MTLPRKIQDNLQFLCVEVDSQLTNMQRYFEQDNVDVKGGLIDRVGYVHNLKTRIHSAVVKELINNHELDSRAILKLRTTEFVANELERVADVCRNCVVDAKTLLSLEGLMPKNYIKLLKEVQRAIKLIIPAIEQQDAECAIQIGQISYEVEAEHQDLLKKHVATLKHKKQSKPLIPWVFIAYELKQIALALVHICESILSANLGQQVSFDGYVSLQSLVSEMDVKDLQIESVAETRSGSAISSISSADNSYHAIYKGGQKRKLKEEKEGLNSWHTVYPGLAPKIISYKKKGGSASLLIEHLPGHTFEQIVINESPELLVRAQKQLYKTLRSIWSETKVSKGISAKFMQQLQKRLPEVYKIHPEFLQGESVICGKKLSSFDTLISQADTLEKVCLPAFSVYIHGDFNIDNIIYEPNKNRINFIDLHRSRYMDYVQDVSTFMVSNYRLQRLDAERRLRIMAVARSIYGVSRRYALRHNDATFDIRLALGLARAFATSTRFILDKPLAREMFLRARYLIELVLAVESDKRAKFKLPLKEIFVE